jgi:hypothetical protein
MPFGTALGVFTFIVLLRPSVEMLYRSGAAVSSALPPNPGPGAVTTA